MLPFYTRFHFSFSYRFLLHGKTSADISNTYIFLSAAKEGCFLWFEQISHHSIKYKMVKGKYEILVCLEKEVYMREW
jgi:hypothetical protein